MPRKALTDAERELKAKVKRIKRLSNAPKKRDPLHHWTTHLRDEPFCFEAVGHPVEYRHALNLTQEAMARTLGVSLRKWQMVEAGEVTLNTAEIFGLRYLVACKYHPNLEKRMYKAVHYMLSMVRPILAERRTIKKEIADVLRISKSSSAAPLIDTSIP